MLWLIQWFVHKKSQKNIAFNPWQRRSLVSKRCWYKPSLQFLLLRNIFWKSGNKRKKQKHKNNKDTLIVTKYRIQSRSRTSVVALWYHEDVDIKPSLQYFLLWRTFCKAANKHKKQKHKNNKDTMIDTKIRMCNLRKTPHLIYANGALRYHKNAHISHRFNICLCGVYF